MAGPERLTVKSRNMSEKVPETGLQPKLTQEGKKSSPTYRWKDMHFLKHTYLIPEKPPQQQFDGKMRMSAVITS
jgi:hypothetical protein